MFYIKKKYYIDQNINVCLEITYTFIKYIMGGIIMIQEVRVSGDIKIVFSEGELGYQEVIEDFDKADTIRIVTFNIKYKGSELVDLLQHLNEEKDVRLISNIPSSEEWLKNYYLDKLDRKCGSIITYINKKNHAKIVLTENIAYIGSQNYSDKCDNIEVGVIIKDKNIIQSIIEDVILNIQKDSVEYYGRDVERALITSRDFQQRLNSIYPKVFEQVLVDKKTAYDGHCAKDEEEELTIDFSSNILSECEVNELRELIDEIYEDVCWLLNVCGDTADLNISNIVESIISYIEEDSLISIYSREGAEGIEEEEDKLDRMGELKRGQNLYHQLVNDMKVVSKLLDIAVIQLDELVECLVRCQTNTEIIENK